MALQEFAGDEAGHHLGCEKEETVQIRFHICMRMCVERGIGFTTGCLIDCSFGLPVPA